MEIVFLHSPYWLLPGAILIGLVCFLLYRNSKVYNSRQRLILATLRFLSLFFILFFLLGPSLLSRENFRIKPRLLWIEDQSASMQMHGDSAALDSALQSLQLAKSGLDDKYEQFWFGFAGELSEDSVLDQDFTNIYEALRGVNDRFYGEPVGGVVLLSDGIYNRGRNPIQWLEAISGVPVYTLVHGNTQRQRDLRISGLRYNETLSLGRKLSIEIDLEAQNAEAQSFALVLRNERSQVIQSRTYNVDREEWFQSLILEVQPEKEGFHNYSLSIEQKEEDANPQNDNRFIGLEVIKEAYQILVYSEETHPDVAALRRALGTERNWELVYERSRSELDLANTQVLIAFSWDNDLLRELKEKNIPVLFMAHANSDLAALNFLEGMEREPELQFALPNANFGLFAMPQGFESEMLSWPPVQGIYGNAQLPDWAESLFYKRIGRVDLNEPLAFCGELDGQRIAVFSGRGIWKWRIYNYRNNKNTEVFDGLFTGLVDYLQSQERSEDLIIEFEREIFENRSSQVIAKLYDATGKLQNRPELNLSLQSSKGEQYDYSFSKESNFYQLALGGLDAGVYAYSAQADLGAKQFEAKGSIWIKQNVLEARDLQARRGFMEQLAVQSDGKFFELKDWPQLIRTLKQTEPIGQIDQRNIKRELLSKWWLFFVALISLSVEWFLRKYWGQY